MHDIRASPGDSNLAANGRICITTETFNICMHVVSGDLSSRWEWRSGTFKPIDPQSVIVTYQPIGKLIGLATEQGFH